MNKGVVQSFWAGGPLSRIARLGVQSFVAHGHEVHLYCYDPVDNAPHGAVMRDAREILSRDAFLGQMAGPGADLHADASNAFRYKLLFDRGGCWTDTDVVCLQPLDFPAESVFASEQADASYGGAAAIASVIKLPAGSPLMRWMWRMCCDNSSNLGLSHRMEPRLLHKGVHTFGWEEDMCLPAVFRAPTGGYSSILGVRFRLPLKSMRSTCGNTCGGRTAWIRMDASRMGACTNSSHAAT
jgi:hypothetical protein